jgi:hypothetical protein
MAARRYSLDIYQSHDVNQLKPITMASKMTVQLTGRINNLVFYKLGDRYCVRTVPQKVKQTKATRARGKQFGIASRAGKAVRQQLLPVIPFPSDNNMQTRLVSAIYQYIKSTEDAAGAYNIDLPFITGFQFTAGYTITERWKVVLTINRDAAGTLQLFIPAFIPSKDISAPAGTVSVTCNIAAGGFGRATGIATGGYATSLHFEYNDIEIPEQVVALPMPMLPGSVIVTGISLQYNTIKNGREVAINKQAFMPAGIVSAMFIPE